MNAATLPKPRVPDPATAPLLRWGVLGTGWIAERFVEAAHRFTAQRVVAVGSRSEVSARAFADRFAITRAHGAYEKLAADPEVDVVYVATPHNYHLPHGLIALGAGKHTLIEKPVGLNAAQARRLAAAAQAANLFCAEALWSLFLPKFDVIGQVLERGMLGEVQTVLADNGEWFPPEHRIQSPELAGGPMLDLGTYPLSMTSWILDGEPEVVARGVPAPSGVNGQLSALLSYPSGAQSLVHTTLLSDTPTRLVVAGSEATLVVPGRFYRPGPFHLDDRHGRQWLSYTEPESMYAGLAYEAAEVARRIMAGDTATPVRTMADSVETLTVMDEIRSQLGITYAEET